MKDIDFAEVFGTENTPAPSGDEGVKETAPAEPSVDTSNAGEKVEDVADPQIDTNGGEGSSADGSSTKTAENAAFAAARRRAEAEKDQAIEQVKQQSEQEMNRLISGMGLKNPSTGAPVTNKAEYDAYLRASADQRKRQFMQKNGMGEAEYDSFVSELPEVKEARAERDRLRAEQEQAAADRAKKQLGEDLAAIAKIDPSIKSFDDLRKLESFPRIYDRVSKQGLTIKEAFVLENHDSLMSQYSAAGRQSAINAIDSKSHLSVTANRGEGSISVPRDVFEEYRRMMPDATDAEIQKHYNRYKGN